MNFSKLTKLTILKFMFIVLISAGIAGTALFFPVQMDGRYTCLYHKILDDHQPVGANECEAGDKKKIISQKQAGNKHGHDHSDLLLERYIRHYAGLWWGSIALIVIGYLVLKKVRRQDNEEDIAW